MSTKEMTGRDVNWRTGINMVDPETGLTPLMVAAIQGKQPIALALLERGADLNYIETRKGRTALHIAARAGHVGVLQELLKRDPRVNSTDRFQKTPLMHAAKGGYLDCVSALISRQAGVNMTDENGFSALHYAARWGHYQVAGALIIAGGAIELRDEFDGKTALHWAAQYGRKETVIALLDLGAKVNRRSATEKLTALMLASREGYKSIVSILLSRGADANILDAFGWTALHFACSWGRRDTAQILIVEGLAHINSREYGAGTGGEAGTAKAKKDDSNRGGSTGGITPLVVACKGGHIEVVKVLLHYGADINLAERIEYNTPLQCAAALGLNDVVQCLVDYNASINQQNELNGKTALMIAAEYGRRGVLIILLNHLADLNILSKPHLTCHELAVKSNFLPVLLEAVCHLSPRAKCNVIPWVEVEVAHLSATSTSCQFLTSFLHTQGALEGLFMQTSDRDVYLIYALVMLQRACCNVTATNEKNASDLQKLVRKIDAMLVKCCDAEKMSMDCVITDCFILGRVPCSALGPYQISYFAPALVTGPLALYIQQHGMGQQLLGTFPIQRKISQLFASNLRANEPCVEGYGYSQMWRLRYMPRAMFICAVLGYVGYLGFVVYFTTQQSDDLFVFKQPSLGWIEIGLMAYGLSVVLYELGQLEEKRFAVSPSIIIDQQLLEQARWRQIKEHFVENPWKMLDLVTCLLAVAWIGLRIVGVFAGLPSLHPISSHLLVLSVLPLTLSSSRIALLHAPLAIELLTVCKLLSGLLVFVWLIVLLLFAFVVLFVVFQSQHVQQVFERLFFTVFYTQYEEQMESSYTWLWGVFVVMMVLLFNAMVGSIAANYPEMKKASEEDFRLIQARLLASHLLVLERSPLCMLPPPLNLLPAVVYGLHVYTTWRGRLQLQMATVVSIGGAVAEVEMYLLLLFPVAVWEYWELYVMSNDAGLLARFYYLMICPFGILHAICCLLLKLLRTPFPRIILKSRLSDGRLRLWYPEREGYEFSCLSRFEDQRVNQQMEQFATSVFAGDRLEAFKQMLKEAHSEEDEDVNRYPLKHHIGEQASSFWASLSGTVRKQEDLTGRKIRIAPSSAYLQLANVESVEDAQPPGLTEERIKPESLDNELSAEEDVQYYSDPLLIEGEVIPGNNSMAYASQYDHQRASAFPSADQLAGASKPPIWWTKDATRSTGIGKMSPYQPGILNASQWGELAGEVEPQNAHITSTLQRAPPSANNRPDSGQLQQLAENGTDEGGEAMVAHSLYFPIQRFAPIFQTDERTNIFRDVLPSLIRDDFTHALANSERNLHLLENKLKNVESVQHKQLELLQRLVEQQQQWNSQYPQEY